MTRPTNYVSPILERARVNLENAPRVVVAGDTASGNAGYLPDKAAAKLESSRDQVDDARAVARAAADRLNDAVKAKVAAQHSYDELTDPAAASRAGNMDVSPDHPSAQDAKARLDKATAEHARAQERNDAAAHRRDGPASLLLRIEGYLKNNRGQALQPFDGPDPKRQRSETATQAVERCRKERATLEADLHEARSAPRTAAETKALAKAQIERLAEKGMPDLFSLLEGASDGVKWPTENVRFTTTGTTPVQTPGGQQVYADGIGNVEYPDTLSLFCWTHRDALLERLNSEIDAIADDGAALSVKDRAAKETSLLAAMLDAERAEEFFTEQAEAQGQTIERRTDLDPRAFLGVIGPGLERV